jgi:integrase/recombinase XerD
VALWRWRRISGCSEKDQVEKDTQGGLHSPKIISDKEINAMLRAADHPRDRALVSFFAGTGVRLNEALTVRMRDVEVYPNGTLKFTVSGKTGPYPTAIVVGGYAANIRAWLNHHPYRDNLDAPLWIKRRGAVWECISDNGMYAMITRLAKKAGDQAEDSPAHVPLHAIKRGSEA